MPNISSEELLRLRLIEAVTPHALGRGAHPAAIKDIARRLAESGKFKVGEESAELLGGGDLAIGKLVEELANNPATDFLFQNGEQQSQAADTHREAEAERIAKLTPRQKLDLANEESARRRRAAVASGR